MLHQRHRIAAEQSLHEVADRSVDHLFLFHGRRIDKRLAANAVFEIALLLKPVYEEKGTFNIVE